jgi:hypothetical protein
MYVHYDQVQNITKCFVLCSTGIAGSNSTVGMDVCPPVSVLSCAGTGLAMNRTTVQGVQKIHCFRITKQNRPERLIRDRWGYLHKKKVFVTFVTHQVRICQLRVSHLQKQLMWLAGVIIWLLYQPYKLFSVKYGDEICYHRSQETIPAFACMDWYKPVRTRTGHLPASKVPRAP